MKEEQRKKRSESMKKRWANGSFKGTTGTKRTPEQRKKTSDALKGRMPKNLSLINANKKGEGNPMWGKHTSEKQKETARKRRNELHNNWKGDKATPTAKHQWLYRRKGKAKDYKCSCGEQAKEWCNIDHKYSRNLDDYIPVCRLCHEIFHKANNLRYKIKTII